jgi:hypothetical protein
MRRRERSAAAEVVPWWSFLVVGVSAAIAGYLWIAGHAWLGFVPFGLGALLVPRLWWRHLPRGYERDD